ncbi:LrgB-like family-domain-containing protein [Ilyonectria robusta]|uniref:LrgB-like family-domain-containing protein n=1 Tax=Ilyonectria robusta TaxID=1079257 RepID=UPI001E8D0AAA|nr:LrgB-like family-domain-containing protein [Ilyonectria robusta]KAH8694668.1 LrgB-like family-domain-containing protein [Ilyonectria robusta]
MAQLGDLQHVPRAVKLAAISSRAKLVQQWIYVPCGLMVALVACFGIDSLFRKVNVAFPASVACLVLLFLALLGSESWLGSHRTRKTIAVIDVSAGWSLRWMGVFFTPSFILLPLSPPIGVVEVFKIIAVFIIGFFVMMALAAWLTRGLQLALGSSKRSESQRAEELGRRTPDIPISSEPTTPGVSRRTSFSQATSMMPLVAMPGSGPPSGPPSTPPSVPPSRPQSPPLLRLQEHHYSNGRGPENVTEALSRHSYPSQTPIPSPKAEQWAAAISANLDLSTFIALFLFVGIPLYYSTGYAMVAHLTLNILAYMAAMAIPGAWKQYLHPVLVSSLLTVLSIWALAAIRGDDLTTTLTAYRTGAKYLKLWQNTHSQLLPGAGDVFGTLLDASIVALALPMFQYRRELRAHFISIVAPNVAISVGSLLAYPPLCRAIGISASRSLAFASRSLTLALAVPATSNLGGDVNTVAALAIISGILGVIFGSRILAWLRVPEDDYVTRGVTLGVNSSAIATALLLRTDPRAAALSSLSMSLFGTITVLFTSIPPVATFVRALVGL